MGRRVIGTVGLNPGSFRKGVDRVSSGLKLDCGRHYLRLHTTLPFQISVRWAAYFSNEFTFGLGSVESTKTFDGFTI